MEFATVALHTLLPKLAQLLNDEYKLQKGVRKDIEFLSSELEIMHAALDKVGEVPIEHLDKMQRIWARDVRDLSYDMEDIVDTFMVDVQGLDAPSKRSIKKIFKKMIRKVTKAMARREIAQEIKDIKQRVKDVAERRDRYKFDAITSAKITPVDPRITSLYTEAKELVGIDEAKKEVITRLTKGDVDQHQERIISIAGFGGLGKTTLAKVVFDEIKGQFDCKAFVSVSRNPDINKLLKGILFELHNGGDGNNFPGANLDETTQLIYLVRKYLQNRRYLIVIDDIWDIDPWKTILCALNIENNMGSRIITTTRIIGVAEHVGGCYRLKPLTNEDSEKLFYERIFGEDKCPEQFSEVSKKILKKCGGVPLAIISTSSLLANKSDNIKEWYGVCDSIGLGLGSNPDMDSMRKILMLSYYDLPSHLKTCLLYLSIFPEDYVIEKGPLIRKWVAEGFVQHGQKDQSFLETGESYFNELLNRSLIQPRRTDEEGTPKACQVHDTVLDMIISLSKEECFISTTSGDGKHYWGSEQVRRLSLHDDSTYWPTMNVPSKLRSLTIFKPAAVIIDPTPSLSCHLLRVLDLGGRILKDLGSLGFLGSLSHLRYLGLSSSTGASGIDQLPAEIGKLRFLQTLDLSRTMVYELPSSFRGLTQLMCLRVCEYWLTRLPDGLLENLTSLEVLEKVAITPECFAEELGHLTRLRELDVMVESRVEDRQSWQACGEAMVESLGKLQKIESLYIGTDLPRRTEFVMDGSVEPPLGNLRWLHLSSVETVPTWINGASLPALCSLDITVTHVRKEDIQALGTLPCLRRLTFWAFPTAMYRGFLGELHTKVPSVVPSMFPTMPRLEHYEFAIEMEDFCGASVFLGGAMPRLEDYYTDDDLAPLCFCRSGAPLYTVDDLVLAHLPSLRSVTVGLSGAYGDCRNVRWSVREKLEQEAAAHPNHPHLRTKKW